MKLCVLLSVLMLVVTGCEAIQGPDAPATLQAENLEILSEATAIAQSAQSDSLRVQQTADAMNAQAAAIFAENQQLLATVRARDPLPQMQRIIVSGVRPTNLEPGQRWFVKTGVGTSVRQSDGCIEQAQISFPDTVERLYATVLAFNIEAGVVMSVSWSREGIEVMRESWPLARGSSEIGMWFSIDRTDGEFTPGSWSATLCADGFQLEAPMSFSILPS